MPSRLAACISLAAALLCVPAAAHAKDVVRPSSVEAGTTVPAGGATTLTLRCPVGAVALNAAITSHGAGVTVSRSIPGSDAGDWSFRLTAAAGARSRGARALLRCVRLELPAGFSGVRVAVVTHTNKRIAVPAGSSTAVQVRCGGAWTGTGYGLERSARGRVKIAAALPAAHGWNFRLENTGARAGRAAVSVRCLRTAVTGRSGGATRTLRFEVVRREFSDSVGPGPARTFSHSCGLNQFSVATGSVVDSAGAIELSGSHPSGSRGGRWAFRRASAGDQVSSFLVCLARHTQFR
jgi:hypothetical protein